MINPGVIDQLQVGVYWARHQLPDILPQLVFVPLKHLAQLQQRCPHGLSGGRILDPLSDVVKFLAHYLPTQLQEGQLFTPLL